MTGRAARFLAAAPDGSLAGDPGVLDTLEGMLDSLLQRLPYLAFAVVVYALFHFTGVAVRRIVRRVAAPQPQPRPGLRAPRPGSHLAGRAVRGRGHRDPPLHPRPARPAARPERGGRRFRLSATSCRTSSPASSSCSPSRSASTTRSSSASTRARSRTSRLAPPTCVRTTGGESSSRTPSSTPARSPSTRPSPCAGSSTTSAWRSRP